MFIPASEAPSSAAAAGGIAHHLSAVTGGSVCAPLVKDACGMLFARRGALHPWVSDDVTAVMKVSGQDLWQPEMQVGSG